MKKRTNLGKVYIGIAIIAAMAFMPVLSVSAQSTGGIGGRPANPRPDNPRTQSIFVHQIEAGKSVDDAVLVSNGSDKTRTIELYTVDGVVTNTGAYTCRQKAEPIQDSAAWIKLDTNELTLKAGENKKVPFRITVPESGVSVGEHNACVVFADKNDEGQTAGAGVRIQTRQAIRVVTTIPGDLKLAIGIKQFTVDNKTMTIVAQNQGNVSSDTEVSVQVKSLLGSIQQQERGQYPILPDEDMQLTFNRNAGSFWGGWYKAQAMLRYNNESAGTLGYNESKPFKEELSDEKLIFVMPSAAALLIYGLGLVFVVGGLFWLIFASIRRKTRVKAAHRHTVKQDETIESVAKKYGVSWKIIAKMNKLDAPYTLTAGKEILVPAKTKGRTAQKK